MKKAFWDAILESVEHNKPNYIQICGLVREVRDEICAMAPESWKQEIFESIDLDILSQVFVYIFHQSVPTKFCPYLDILNLLTCLILILCYTGTTFWKSGHGLSWENFGIFTDYAAETLCSS